MPTHANTVRIRQFIIENLASHPRDIAARTSEAFLISRQAVNRHLREMEKSGIIECSGKTNSRIYTLRELVHVRFTVPLAGLEEHVPWSERIAPQLAGIPKNVFMICSYGFTEMLNNAIDHSESEEALIELSRTPDCIDMKILDSGVGIFNKIKNAFDLADELEAITELAKGKLTTDPANHSGEGIFFTSRIFDHFSLHSGDLYFSHTRPNDDWLIEDRTSRHNGTYVRMQISPSSTMESKAVFDKFASEDGDFQFSKTHVPVKLLQYGSDNLVSRSQAKRLLSRFEMFEQVWLDFEGVESIGQAFADEIFRVYQNQHPELRLVPVNMAADVRDMVKRSIARREEERRKQLSEETGVEWARPAKGQKKLFLDEPEPEAGPHET